MSERPFFAATPDGAEAVVRAARRRRRMQGAAAISVVGVVVGAAVALRTPGTGLGSDRLSVAGGGVTASGSPSPRPTVGGAAPSPSTAGASGRPVPVGTGSAAAGIAPPPVAGPASSPSPGASRVARVSPIRRSTGSIASTDLCNDDTTDAGQGWCVRYLGPSTARRGHPVNVSAEICRMSAFTTTTIRFASTREIDLEVDYNNQSSSTVAWTAGEGEHYTSPGPSVTVAGGTCLIWTSTWDTRDENGFLVPPGSYDVSFGIAVTEAGVFSTWFGSGTIDVTD